MFDRRSFKGTFKDRLASFAKDIRDKASLLPPGMEQNDLHPVPSGMWFIDSVIVTVVRWQAG